MGRIELDDRSWRVLPYRLTAEAKAVLQLLCMDLVVQVLAVCVLHVCCCNRISGPCGGDRFVACCDERLRKGHQAPLTAFKVQEALFTTRTPPDDAPVAFTR